MRESNKIPVQLPKCPWFWQLNLQRLPNINENPIFPSIKEAYLAKGWKDTANSHPSYSLLYNKNTGIPSPYHFSYFSSHLSFLSFLPYDIGINKWEQRVAVSPFEKEIRITFGYKSHFLAYLFYFTFLRALVELSSIPVSRPGLIFPCFYTRHPHSSILTITIFAW